MSKYLNKILKNKARKDIGTLKKSNGDYTTPGTETPRRAGKQTLLHTHWQKRNCLPRHIHNEARITYKIQSLDK